MSRVRGSVVSTATKKILEKIENYELLTGDIVSDLELSKEFDMSRTPVREAIMSLLDCGILERTETKVVVKAITLSDIIEILEVRDAVEQKSIEIIFKNGGLTDSQRSELLLIHDNLCKTVSNRDFNLNFYTDDSFHKKIVEFSGNSRFLDICERVSLQTQRLRWITLLTPNRYGETHEEHSVIIKHILDGSVENAKKAVHKHFTNSQLNYESILNNPQWINIALEMKRMRN